MPGKVLPGGLRISIDRGGTFTDCVCNVPGSDDIVVKILSVDPNNYADAPSEAIRQVLERYYGTEIKRGTKLDLKDVEWVRMGTTVATNALLERKGERVALLITEGFQDLLHIGNQSRPHMFDLAIRKPDVLYSKVAEVSERVVLQSCTDSGRADQPLTSPLAQKTVEGVTGEIVQIIKPLDEDAVRATLREIAADGYNALAVCLMHSYTFPEHELKIFEIAKDIGFGHISLSHRVSQRTKIVPRGNSAIVDAYLTPAIERYLINFAQNFENVEKSLHKIEFMQSDGGLVPSKKLSGLRAVLSGPAGGVVGYAETCYDRATQTPVIGFDMGGTSTDVSRYAGSLEHIFETTTAGVAIQSPQLDINTIAAGGGSILTWRNGLLTVGPESASSDPGPACYRKGGPLTVTDANLLLGRLVPTAFPSVFGPQENEPLDTEATLQKFREMTATINKSTGKEMTCEEVALGFIKVANTAMCGPVRILTEARGFDASQHDLACFGGAGGQHACSIAENLKIQRVLIHKYSSILSAYGIGLADIVQEEQIPCAKVFSSQTSQVLADDCDLLEDKACKALAQGGFKGTVEIKRFYSMRFDGSDTALMITVNPGEDIMLTFIGTHHQEFGFTPVNRRVFVDELRVRAIGKGSIDVVEDPFKELIQARSDAQFIATDRHQNVYFDVLGWVKTPVYILGSLPRGSKVEGPALIIDSTQTIVVTPNSIGFILIQTLVSF